MNGPRRPERNDTETLSPRSPGGREPGRVLPKGEVVGDRYEVVSLLGAGASGTVYRVRDRQTGGDLALKIAPADLLETEGARERFVHEFRLARDLRHPHLVQVMDVESDHGGARVYFTMEWLDDGDLNFKLEQAVLDQRDLPYWQVCSWMGQVAEALAYLHHQGLVHQDIKPANILLAASGEVKLGDFGLAFMPKGDSIQERMTQTALVGGTTYFMSPEQHRAIFYRAREPITPASDVCAFGLTLYNLLSGEVIVGQREPMEEFVDDPDLARELNEFLDGCLARKPERRFQNGEDLLIALRRALALVRQPTAAKRGVSLLAKLKGEVFATTVRAGDTRDFSIHGDLCLRMCWIPPGTRPMGAPGRDPVPVTLSLGFWMSETPVTQEQWLAIMGENPSFFKGKHHPVDMVSWHDANAFMAVLNERAGSKVYRLPTEAEWQYACLAGQPEPELAVLDTLGWHAGNAQDTTHRVKGKAANAWGLHDMHGNVWEWCADFYDDYFPHKARDPKGPHRGTQRVVRGGSWNRAAKYCRAVNRHPFSPDYKNLDTGFRVLRRGDR